MSENFDVPKPLSGTGGWLDDRFHGARGFRVLMRKVFPDHWSLVDVLPVKLESPL